MTGTYRSNPPPVSLTVNLTAAVTRVRRQPTGQDDVNNVRTEYFHGSPPIRVQLSTRHREPDSRFILNDRISRNPSSSPEIQFFPPPPAGGDHPVHPCPGAGRGQNSAGSCRRNRPQIYEFITFYVYHL